MEEVEKKSYESIKDLLLDITTGGIDFSDAMNGGEKCWKFQGLGRRLLDMAFMTAIAFVCFKVANVTRTKQPNFTSQKHSESLRTLILFSFTFINGVEFCYKCVNRDLIFLWNSCHILSYTQIFIVAAFPIPATRKMAKWLYEATLPAVWMAWGAFIFPATGSRNWTFEYYSYYVHHILLLVTPIYLGQQFPESVNKIIDTSVIFRSLGVSLIYCVVTHVISYATYANINVQLCPFNGLPAAGPYYRLYFCLFSLFFNLACWIVQVYLCRFCSGPEEVKKVD